MVKVTAPMMSLGASGSIGDAMTFSTWKGRPYVRKLVKPANPRSGGQVGMRAMFKFLTQQWAKIGAPNQALWEPRADQGVYSPFNAYMSFNTKRWRDFLSPAMMDDPNQSAISPVLGVATATAGVRSITVSQAVTTENDGWGIAVFRSTSTGFSTSFDNLIACSDIVSISPAVVVDTPLIPDTYYYNIRGFTDDGVLGAEEGEISATVT